MIQRRIDTFAKRASARRALVRLRARTVPILQTAVAAVAAWYLAKLVLPGERPVFAVVAAVIAVGASYGQRRHRAVELIGGVVLGIGVADLLVMAFGAGPIQLGVLVILASAAAVMLGGGPILVTEAAVSAILLVMLEPSGSGLPPERLVEALVGGGVALVVAALAFPLDPVLLVSRSAQAVFGQLGRTLEELAAALDEGDSERAQNAHDAARELDERVRELEEALVLGGETARFSPGRRSSLGELSRYVASARHIDYAVRNTDILARNALRHVRGGEELSGDLPGALRDLGLAVWALAAELADTRPHGAREVRFYASRAAARATESFEGKPGLALAEIVVLIRSTAIDLVRAAEAGAPGGTSAAELSTEELLVDMAPAEQ